MITNSKATILTNSKQAPGFTLIELMIALTILGILCVIAYPSYTHYTLRAGRAEGAASLLEVMERQEQYYRSNLTYTTRLADLGYSATDPVKSETDRYRITAAACGTLPVRRCVNLVATAQPKQIADGPTITLNSRGEKTGNWPGK